MDQAVISERDLIPYETSVFEGSCALVLAAHADDEVFGCGAAIAGLRARGASVHVAVFTDGAGDEPDAARRREIGELRLRESRAALDHLGGAALTQGPFQDRRLTERKREAAAEIGRLLAEVRPELVFAPSPAEIHPDHRALAEAVLAFAAAMGGGAHGTSGARDSREVLVRSRVAFYELSQPIRPNVLFDATAAREAKDRAMEEFRSQNASRDYPGYIRGLNAYRRMTLPASVTAAEGYYVVAGDALLTGGVPAFVRALGPSIETPRPGSPWRRMFRTAGS